MSTRRRLARERLEIYLVYLILAYQRLILISGLIMLAFGIAAMFTNLLVACMMLVSAIFLLLVGASYNVALFTARLAAWIGTLGRQDD